MSNKTRTKPKAVAQVRQALLEELTVGGTRDLIRIRFADIEDRV